MFQNLIANWKTASFGILTIIGAITHLVFSVKAKNITEETVIAEATALLTGIGIVMTALESKNIQKTYVAGVIQPVGVQPLTTPVPPPTTPKP